MQGVVQPVMREAMQRWYGPPCKNSWKNSCKSPRKSSCKGVALLCAALGLAGCQQGLRTEPELVDGPPGVVPADLENLPDPLITDLPRSRTGNPVTYTEAGTTYRVLDTAHRYEATGVASWYGSKFHGRRTSSGENFDMFALTAAHTTIPIPAFARVTNLENGRTTVVRINDRGPFHVDRLVDVSFAAAVKLGFAELGTARVRLEVLEPPANYYLQAGAFSELAAADQLKEHVAGLTEEPVYVVKVPHAVPYRVRIGPVKGRTEAVRIQTVISAAALTPPLILPF